jgi:hypothetical protein
VNRRLASHRILGVGAIWHAGDDEPAALTATAEAVAPALPQVVHYHLHLPPGTDLSGLRLALPPGSAVTTEEEN